MMNGSNLGNSTSNNKSKDEQVVNGHDENENNPFAEYMWMENEEDFNRQAQNTRCVSGSDRIPLIRQTSDETCLPDKGDPVEPRRVTLSWKCQFPSNEVVQPTGERCLDRGEVTFCLLTPSGHARELYRQCTYGWSFVTAQQPTLHPRLRIHSSFHKVEEELQEQDFLDRCFQEMLDEEDQDWFIPSRDLPQGVGQLQQQLNGLSVNDTHCTEDILSKSTLNPDAKEFVPGVKY